MKAINKSVSDVREVVCDTGEVCQGKNGLRLIYISIRLEGEIQRKICKFVNFHFKPHKLFKC